MTPLPRPDYISYDATRRTLSLDPHEGAFYQNPYAAYAWLHQQDGPVFWKEFGFWCFGGHDDVNRLLRDRRFGRAHAPGGPDSQGVVGDRSHLTHFDALETRSLLEVEPPTHTRLRTLVNRAFVSRQVEKLRPRIEALAEELIDGFAGAGEVDLMAAYASPFPVTIIAGMLGVPEEMGPQLLDWSHAMVGMYMHGRTRAMEDAADRASLDFADYLRGIVAERRAAPADDLISLLVSAQADGDRLSEDELISSVILLLNAGHEATVHQTGNAVKAVLEQGGDPRRFFASPQATAATVEECLRFDAPLHLFTRNAYEHIEAGGGVIIEPGQQIGLLLGSANRDPRVFGEPARFDPARTDQKNSTFGAGIHFCIGAPLARLELQISLKRLFDRLPGLALAEAPLYRDTYHFHGLERLTVRT